VFLTATEGEVLFSDTTRFAERAQQAGVDVTVRLVKDSVHVFTLFAFLPETQNTIKLIADWASTRLHGVEARRVAVG
jgi:salicylate hydroxylase